MGQTMDHLEKSHWLSQPIDVKQDDLVLSQLYGRIEICNADISDMSHKLCARGGCPTPQKWGEKISSDLPRMPKRMPKRVPERMPKRMPEYLGLPETK